MVRIAWMSFEDIEDLDVGVNALVNDLWRLFVELPVTTMTRVTMNPVRGKVFTCFAQQVSMDHGNMMRYVCVRLNASTTFD